MGCKKSFRAVEQFFEKLIAERELGREDAVAVRKAIGGLDHALRTKDAKQARKEVERLARVFVRTQSSDE